ncbi:MFS transporter [Corynebacterium kutscheri]|uniref:Major Facilitator Superfamily n=1 Tax=Corynebacterium kutscheri TaxID=35755 RepID=A0AB38VPM6_9CORY|nr:MFS transporter [Corynebacterium kutscheri]VEH04968.1 Major Facilitator Superfamily [Corynebacterium kutscheri]
MKASYLHRYRLAYYLKSTALTMPVLPIWWSQQPGVGVSVYLAGMAIQAIVSLVIDFPLSLWSDKTQPRIPYAIGLGIFALAFIATCVSGLWGFIGYLVLLCIAGALMSGSDIALLMDITKDQFKTELYELNRRFYLFTSGLFLVGVGLYLISPKLLFGIQALFLAVAACLIATLRTTAHQPLEATSSSEKVALAGNWRISPTLTWGIVVMAICLAGGEFEAVNQLLNRSLQIVVAAVSIAHINSLWTVAGVLVITNMLSSLGLGTRARQLSEKHGVYATLIALVAGTLASLMFINSGMLPVIVLGAVVMGITKGIYRPLVTTLVMQALPSAHWKARWLSVTGMLSSLVSSVINVLIVLGNPPESEIIQRMAIQLLCVMVPTVIIISARRRLALPLATKEITNKITRRVIKLGQDHPAWLEQTYVPANNQIISRVVASQLASDLPHPQILHCDDDRIEFEFINGPILEDVEPTRRWQVLSQHRVFMALHARKSLPSADLAQVAQTQFAQECAQICNCSTVSHGNVHPGNILLHDNNFVLVNWDHSGNSSRALDELALLTHPDLNATLDQRISMFRKLVTAHNNDCPIHAMTYQQVAKRVVTAKIIDIHSWNDSETKSYLLLAYDEARKSL